MARKPAKSTLAKKCIRATTTTMGIISTVLSIGLGVLALDFYRSLDILREIPECTMMLSTARNLVLFNLGAFYVCLAGVCFLNNGSFRFKISFAAVIGLMTLLSLSLKSTLADSQQNVHSGMEKHFSNYYASKESKLIVDAIQNRHHCCGYDSAAEFPKYRRLPDSCCPQSRVKKEGKCLQSHVRRNICRFELNVQFASHLPSLDFLLFLTASILTAELAVVLYQLTFSDDDELAASEGILTLGPKAESIADR